MKWRGEIVDTVLRELVRGCIRGAGLCWYWTRGSELQQLDLISDQLPAIVTNSSEVANSFLFFVQTLLMVFYRLALQYKLFLQWSEAWHWKQCYTVSSIQVTQDKNTRKTNDQKPHTDLLWSVLGNLIVYLLDKNSSFQQHQSHWTLLTDQEYCLYWSRIKSTIARNIWPGNSWSLLLFLLKLLLDKIGNFPQDKSQPTAFKMSLNYTKCTKMFPQIHMEWFRNDLRCQFLTET